LEPFCAGPWAALWVFEAGEFIQLRCRGGFVVLCLMQAMCVLTRHMG
jgi:hypothetical protein